MTATWPGNKRRRGWRHPVLVALGVSVLLHLYGWVMVRLLDQALERNWLPAWLRPALQPVASLLADAPPPPQETQPAEPEWQEIPLHFVEVDPLLVTAEAPEETPYFSTANTLAANPNPAEEERNEPRVEGFREDSLKTFDTPRPVEEVIPAAPKPTPAPEPQEVAAVTEFPPVEVKEVKEAEAREKKEEAKEAKVAREPQEERGIVPGETLLAKADPKATELTPQPAQERQVPQEAQEPVVEPPRRFKSLAEARAAKGMLVGERMKSNENTRRTAIDSSLNVKASPLGDYNYRLVQAVQRRWYQLLEERHFAFERAGKAVIKFKLHEDGTVSEVAATDTQVGDLLTFLCELSVMQPAPYGRWPSEVSRVVGRDFLEVTFTFNYY